MRIGYCAILLSCIFALAVPANTKNISTFGNSQNAQHSRSGGSASHSVVVWLSIDGFRHDYLREDMAPNLYRLASEGAYTTHEIPVFPSVTFPNHTAQVTGTTVEQSGIPLNDFFDTATNTFYNFSDEPTLMRTEPIWATAKRQGLRVAVIGWPLSQNQGGRWAADYFDVSQNRNEMDAPRLRHVTELLKNDSRGMKSGQNGLNLILTYVEDVDTAGHRFGPHSPELRNVVHDEDERVGTFVDSVTHWFDSSHGPKDQLYVVITTDHGMVPVRSLVSLDRFIGFDAMSGVRIVLNGPIATVGLDQVPVDQREARLRKIQDRLSKLNFMSVWRSGEIPKQYHMNYPSRIGDLFVILRPGLAFTPERIAPIRPATAGYLGSHGYDPAISREVQGSAVVWHYKHPAGGINLGRVENTQWHSTVAGLLGIEPAAGADTRALSAP